MELDPYRYRLLSNPLYREKYGISSMPLTENAGPRLNKREISTAERACLFSDRL